MIVLMMSKPILSNLYFHLIDLLRLLCPFILVVLLEHDGQHLFQQQHDAQRSCLASSSAPNVKMTQECFWRVPPLSAAVLVPANLFTSPSG